MSKKTVVPVLLGIERTKDGCMAVWCPHCVEFHRHGKEQGHVIAHCTNSESPYLTTGYRIKKVKYYGKKVVLEHK